MQKKMPWPLLGNNTASSMERSVTITGPQLVLAHMQVTMGANCAGKVWLVVHVENYPELLTDGG